MNAKDKDEISGLMEASIMGHVDVVKELLKVTNPPLQKNSPRPRPVKMRVPNGTVAPLFLFGSLACGRSILLL